MSGIIGGNSSRSSGSIAAKGSGITTSASDPTISTNPASVGTMFVNTTSGEVYIATTITAGENVWTNIGDGAGDVAFYQGSSYGYSSGGTATNVIERFSLTSQADAVDVGDLTTTKQFPSGGKSATHGFCCGDDIVGPGVSDVIERYAFAASTSGADHGDLTATSYGQAEASSSTHVYCAGGYGRTSTIDKVVSASNANATDVGDLIQAVYLVGGHSSNTYGYTSGGLPATNVIQKYSFSSDGEAIDVGNLPTTRSYTSGTSSTSHGYSTGDGATSNVIEKFAFASDGDGTDVGDLSRAAYAMEGVSATDYGYVVGGDNTYGGGPAVNTIERYSHVSDGNAVDWADLTVAKSYTATSQS